MATTTYGWSVQPQNVLKATISQSPDFLTNNYLLFSNLPSDTLHTLDTKPTIITTAIMNTNTGDKPADPYKQANAEEVSLDTKVNDLVEFMKNSKFGMMTTKAADSDKLASRCMALAATVRRRTKD